MGPVVRTERQRERGRERGRKSATKAQNRPLQSSLVKLRVENSAVTHTRYALRTLFGNFIFVRFEARLECGATRVISSPRKLLPRSTRVRRAKVETIFPENDSGLGGRFFGWQFVGTRADSPKLRSRKRWRRVRRVAHTHSLSLSFSICRSLCLFVSIVRTVRKWVPTSELAPLVPLVGSSSFAENSIIMIAYDVNDAPRQQLFPSERARGAAGPEDGAALAARPTLRTKPRDVDVLAGRSIGNGLRQAVPGQVQENLSE